MAHGFGEGEIVSRPCPKTRDAPRRPGALCAPVRCVSVAHCCVSWCALPHDGVDLPSSIIGSRAQRVRTGAYEVSRREHFVNTNRMLWRSVVKLACGTACSRDFKDDPEGRVGLERWLASARRIDGRIEFEARHVPTGAKALCVTSIESWFSLGQLRAPLQWLSRDQQRGVAARLVELGLADPTTARLRQKVDSIVGAEPRRHESDDEPKRVRKTRVEREALRRVRKERRRLRKAETGLHPEGSAKLTTTSRIRHNGPRRRRRSRASRIVEVPPGDDAARDAAREPPRHAGDPRRAITTDIPNRSL